MQFDVNIINLLILLFLPNKKIRPYFTVTASRYETSTLVAGVYVSASGS